MSLVQQQLSSLQQHATALQQSLAAVAVAADQNLHASNLVALSGTQSKPAKGVSKSKKAALVLDAMKPLLSTALEQVRAVVRLVFPCTMLCCAMTAALKRLPSHCCTWWLCPSRCRRSAQNNFAGHM